MEQGSLFIVATPIGNLKDVTLRALDTLKSVDRIYCEDTRRTTNLLAAYQIKKPLDSLHHHSSESKIDQVICAIQGGENIAYVSDAGTPGIADPGGLLVERCRQAGIAIIPIPGPSAITSLLSVAGVPANSYWFAGYVPTKKGRQTFIKKLIETRETTVIFETAPRLLKFFDQLIELGGRDKEIVVGRELTKQFEDIQFGLVSELKEFYTINPPKGELVLVLTNKRAKD